MITNHLFIFTHRFNYCFMSNKKIHCVLHWKFHSNLTSAREVEEKSRNVTRCLLKKTQTSTSTSEMLLFLFKNKKTEPTKHRTVGMQENKMNFAFINEKFSG